MAEMTVGREMDAAVALLLGWKWMAYGYTDGPKIALYSPQEMEERAVWTPDAEYPREHDWDDGLPHYSTSDADAFAALDAVMAKHPQMGVLISWHPGARQGAGAWGMGLIGDDTPGLTWGDTRAEAVCRAILALAEATT